MLTNLLITTEYKSVSPYISTKSIEGDLIKNKFVVIKDDDSSFIGLLTLSDMVTNPKNIVIECATKKPLIQIYTKIRDVMNLMIESHSHTLPVFEGTNFLGAITFDSIFNHFLSCQKVIEDKVIELTNEIIKLKNEIKIKINERCIAEKIIAEKKQFAAKLSHEIRTPINAIIGFTSLLLDGKISEEQKESLSIIENSSIFLTAVVDDVLSFSKIESGKLEVEESEFKIVNLIDEIHKMMKHCLIDKNIELIKNIDENLDYIVIGDQIKLKQVIINLITNAIKYTENGKVEILICGKKACDNQIKIKFIIKDTGIGIPNDKIDKIFNEYQRIHNTVTNKNDGFGLGLMISQKIIELLGGKIEVKSIEGKGSEFYFELPFKLASNEPQIIKKTTELIEPFYKILIADDDEISLKLLKIFFNKAGYYTGEVENGQQLIEKLKKENYDFILLDINMPIINGYQATAIIRNELKLNIPIVGLSASTQEETLKKCNLSGMDGLILKPIDFDKLLSLLKLLHENKIKGTEL